MNRAFRYIGGAICITVVVAAFLGYFVSDTSGHDGLGRQLYPAPLLMRIFFGQERYWAGWLWFVGDLLWFWGGLGLGFYLMAREPKDRG